MKNRQTILLSILGAFVLLLTACSNEDNNALDGGKKDVQTVEFKVKFADYNDDQNISVTRAGSKEIKLEQKTIDLGNGLLADCTLQRDTTKQKRHATTRTLANDTYTMLAYDAATHTFKGEMTGTVTGGIFTATSSNASINLTPGTYDFVLYNSKVSRSGNNLTVTRTNADAALIGRTTQTITASPSKQYVPFTMKHAGARVKLYISDLYVDFPGGAKATLSSVGPNDILASSVYDASADTWTAGAGSGMSENVTFEGSPSSIIRDGIISIGSFSKEAFFFMPHTDITKLKLTFTSGTIYNTNLAGASIIFNPSSSFQLEQNCQYILKISLKYNYLYLMSDGTTGFFNETTYGGGSKTPIAVVLSKSKRMAIALNNADNNATFNWCNNGYGNYWSVQANTHMAASVDDALTSSATSGLDETWDPSYTTNAFTMSGFSGVKAYNSTFPAFNAAASYNTWYTGSQPLKWYLPSISDLKWVFSSLSFLNQSTISTSHPNYYYARQVNEAFTQVGGTPLWSETESNGTSYITSTEINQYYYGYVKFLDRNIFWGNSLKSSFGDLRVRPFVAY
ncbi:fimbrillin family protein [Prevotella sp.]